MEYLQTWLDNSEIPIITAFLLGLLTAVSPCPLATNITAIGFISKDINNRNRIFTMVSYIRWDVFWLILH